MAHYLKKLVFSGLSASNENPDQFSSKNLQFQGPKGEIVGNSKLLEGGTMALTSEHASILACICIK